MQQFVLMITAMEGAENCAATLSRQLEFEVQVATTWQGGLGALREREYSVVIVDESIADADPRGADLLWKNAGLAVPLQVNFAITGSSRLARDVRAAIARREQDQALAMRAAASTIERDLRSTVTGLLLQSQLALAEPASPPQLTTKLKLMVELAGTLKQRLDFPRA